MNLLDPKDQATERDWRAQQQYWRQIYSLAETVINKDDPKAYLDEIRETRGIIYWTDLRTISKKLWQRRQNLNCAEADKVIEQKRKGKSTWELAMELKKDH